MVNKDNRDLEWENRILCSDESCIGVIGPDGRCKECGKPYAGELPENISKPETIQDETDPFGATDDSPAPSLDGGAQTADKQPAAPDEDWEQRTLCRDESCIGVIGKDGRCRECGLPFEEEK